MSKTVFVYTMDGCPYCSELKGMLNDEGIVFVERDCDKYELQYEVLTNNTKNEFVPSIEIKDNERLTKRFLTPERDFEELEQAVHLIKKFL